MNSDEFSSIHMNYKKRKVIIASSIPSENNDNGMESLWNPLYEVDEAPPKPFKIKSPIHSNIIKRFSNGSFPVQNSETDVSNNNKNKD